MTLSGPNLSYPFVQLLGVLIPGATYDITVVTQSTVLSGELRVRPGSATINLNTFTVPGTYRFRSVADGPDITIMRNSGYAGNTAVIDSLSFKLL